MPAVLYALNTLNTIIPLIPAASALFANIQLQRNNLEQMIAEKRDPTQAEWDALDKLRDDLHAQVQA